MKKINLYILFTSVLLIFSCKGPLKKGFESYHKYNFHTAKEKFYKLSEKKNKGVFGSFGLAKLYFDVNTPLFDPDSAYKYIRKAHLNYPRLKEKKKEKLDKVGHADSSTIDSLKKEIHTYFFLEATEINRVSSYQHFINEHYDAPQLFQAIRIRDQLAINKAEKKGTADAVLRFIEKYPETHLMDQAVKLYQYRIYKEFTRENTLPKYEAFINKYPGNPHVKDAQDKIYELYFDNYSIKEYERFINQYPNNRNIADAWRKLLDLYLVDYSSEQIAAFSNEYPNYPFQEELMESYQLANTIYFRVKKNGKWGFSDKNQKILIEPEYDWVEPFSNGIAVIGIGDLYYFIDKKGNKLNNEGYDDAFAFSEELAVIEKNGKMGAINRVGNLVVPTEYDDLGNESNGLLYAEKDGKFFYLNAKGNIVFNISFLNASTFKNNVAQVTTERGKGIINSNGEFVIPAYFKQIKDFKEHYYALENDSLKWGIIGESNDTLLPFKYDYVGQLSENRAVVFQNDKYGFIDSTGSFVVPLEKETKIISKELLIYKNNHVPFEKKGKIGLMDTLGEKKIPALFQNIGYYDKLIPIIKEDLWGYCDTNSERVINYQYEWAENFIDTLAIVKMNGLYGMINEKGIFHLPPVYEAIEYITPELLWMRNEKGGRLFTLKGDALFERFFSRIEQFKNDWYQLVNNKGKLYYFNIKEKRFLNPED